MKRDALWHNQKGFTLIELVVTIAVLMIVGISIVVFLTSSFKQYRYSDEEIDLQMESQTTANRLENEIQSTNYAITLDSPSVLNLYSYDESNELIRHQFYLDLDKHRLMYCEYSIVSGAWVQQDTAEVYASYISDITFEVCDENQTAIDMTQDVINIQPSSVKYHIQYAEGEKTYSVNSVISFRNEMKAFKTPALVLDSHN